jgi:hypothetical protein
MGAVPAPALRDRQVPAVQLHVLGGVGQTPRDARPRVASRQNHSASRSAWSRRGGSRRVAVALGRNSGRLPNGSRRGYSEHMKEIWTGRVAQVATKYSEQAPMGTVCCNACRTCLATNAVGLLTLFGTRLVSPLRRLARRHADS